MRLFSDINFIRAWRDAGNCFETIKRKDRAIKYFFKQIGLKEFDIKYLNDLEFIAGIIKKIDLCNAKHILSALKTANYLSDYRLGLLERKIDKQYKKNLKNI